MPLWGWNPLCGKSWIRYWFSFPPWHLLVHNIREQTKEKVKFYSPFDLFEHLVSTIFLTFRETQRKAQEVDAHAQETGRKLQVLMDAVNSCSIELQHSCPRPVSSNATTSGSQQTISAQRQLQWQQSYQGNQPDLSWHWTYFFQRQDLHFLNIFFYLFIFRLLWVQLRYFKEIRSRDVSADGDSATCCTDSSRSRSDGEFRNSFYAFFKFLSAAE